MGVGIVDDPAHDDLPGDERLAPIGEGSDVMAGDGGAASSSTAGPTAEQIMARVPPTAGLD